MKTKLIFLYGFILAVMIAVNVWASFAGGNVIPAGAVIWNLPWGRATFFDTFFGFLTFWLWTAYQEKNWFRRIAAYMLIKLYRLKPNSGIRDLLLRQETL